MRKRNCALSELQVTHYSVCGSGTAELLVSVYSLYGGGTSSQRILHVWKRNCRTSSHIIVCVRQRNFKSHNSLYVESLWFLMQESEVPGSAGPKAPVPKPSCGAVLNCAILAVATTRIVLVCSVLIKHDRIS